jgi:eukaryotic-like serine/threonine-protein kinase
VGTSSDTPSTPHLMTDEAVRLGAALSERYRILREVGAGGMATVYLAEDVKHQRRVALKVLRAELGAVLGTERFLSEINVTANLQHPHLLPLFDSGEADGLLFYVMPYVEGESLRARLERERQLPVEDAVRLAAAVAAALDYAHRQGVIHRDLKPENILLHDGQPLVADFGIALAVSNAGGGRVTQTGLSLGTPQYMSPEQASGDRAVDARSDIYSLGAVLYEMLTGEAPHTGATSQAVLARLLTEKPRSVQVVRPSVPAHVAAAVECALEKLPADRFATVREFTDVLEGRRVLPTATSRGGVTSGAAVRSWRDAARHPLTLAALAVAVIGWGGMLGRPRPVPPPSADTVVQFEFTPAPEEGHLGEGAPFAISPDGRAIAYRAALPAEQAQLYYREMRNLGSRRIADASNVGSITFSPDGRSIAFLAAGESVYRMRLDQAGSPTLVARDSSLMGVAWAGDNIIVGRNFGPLLIFPAVGGPSRPLLALDTAQGEASQRWPTYLGDGETLLYQSVQSDGRTARLAVASLRTARSTVLDLPGYPMGRVDDLLVYLDNNSSRIAGVPFDFTRWRTTAPGATLVDSVGRGFALSHGGTLLFMRGSAVREAELVELDMNGTRHTLMPGRRRLAHPRYSPDGRRVAVGLATDATNEIWLHDRRTGTFTPAVRSAARRPEWSPDGRDLLFVRGGGMAELWRQPADGTAPAVRAQAPSERGQPVQGIFTPDGRHLVYRTGFNGDDVWYRTWEGDTTSLPLAADPSFIERNTSISPDGRWAAYASNESGIYQVYVRPFPGPGPRHAITVDGGDTPVWSPDGRSIYYVNGPYFEVAAITLPDLLVTRRRLFPHGAIMQEWWRNWDLSPDGTRFLVAGSAGAIDRPEPLVVIHNWTAEVRARRAEMKW